MSCESELDREDNEILHYVKLTHAFELMRTEVTQARFSALMGYNPSQFGPNGLYGSNCGGSCPVEMVSWHEALAFANALSAPDGLAQCHDCPGYRLPTEREWEYAARAGTLTVFYSGPITGVIIDQKITTLDLT